MDLFSCQEEQMPVSFSNIPVCALHEHIMIRRDQDIDAGFQCFMEKLRM
jgi:hypothetical protein